MGGVDVSLQQSRFSPRSLHVSVFSASRPFIAEGAENCRRERREKQIRHYKRQQKYSRRTG